MKLPIPNLGKPAKNYDGSFWDLVLRKIEKYLKNSADADTSISEVVEDTSPQLGGNLDPNGFGIAGHLVPSADDTYNLGTTSTAEWANLYLGPNAVIGFDNSDVAITHGTNRLYVTGGSLQAEYGSGSTAPLRSLNNQNVASAPSLTLEGDRSAPADNDAAYVSMILSNDAGTQKEMARLTWTATDVTATTEYGALTFGVMTAGTLANELTLDGSSLSPSTSDGLALGTTAKMWSDIYLASGGEINFSNGDVRITHLPTNYLYGTGGTFQWAFAGLPVRITNTTDSSGNTVASFELSRATPTANDDMYIDYKMNDSASNLDTMMRMTVRATDVTSGSEDARLLIDFRSAGTLTNAYVLHPDYFYHRGNTIYFDQYGSHAANIYIMDRSYNEAFEIDTEASAVNNLVVTNKATGGTPSLYAKGDDTNIDIAIVPKGTGVVSMGTHSAIGAETVTGYITIKDAGGTTRKLAVVS